MYVYIFFFFSSRRRHTRYWRDWSSDVCSSDLASNPSAVKHEPRSVRTCVTWKGKAWTASLRKATALAVVSSSFTARWTQREQRSIATKRKRSEEHTSELQSRQYLVCRLLLEKKK